MNRTRLDRRPIHGFYDRAARRGGAPIEGGDVSKIWIRSRTHARLLGAPSATEDVVIGGWLDSGDLARADADGYLWFFGRKSR